MTVSSRGRKSLAAATTLSAVTIGEKPRAKAPAAFKAGSPEAIVWKSIVDAEAVDWFTSADLVLLEAFCRAAVIYRKASLEAETAPLIVEGSHGGQQPNPIFKLQDLQAKQLAQLATKMRLSQSTRVNAHVAGSAARKAETAGRKPWERTA